MSKKMIFSAVALVAFSFAGMANEIEKNKEEVLVLRNNCDAFAESVYNNQINEGCSVEEAYEASAEAYRDCIDMHNRYDVSLTEA